MTVLPDPRGLIIQALAGSVVFRDYFLPFFLFTGIHYGMIWVTSPANQMPVLMMWQFLVRMFWFFVYGGVAGYALSWAMASPTLIPAYSFDNRRAHPAPALSTLAIVVGVVSGAYATGIAQKHEAFPGGFFTPVGDWILLAISAVVFLYIIWATWTRSKSVFAFKYLNQKKHHYIPEFIIMLILILAPQVIWDFFVLPPPEGLGWAQWSAGALTLGIEAVVWIAIYFWFKNRRNIEDNIFSSENSLVTWKQYVLISGGNQIGFGIAYVVAAEFLADLEELNYFLLASLGVILIESVILYFWLRNTEKNPRATYVSLGKKMGRRGGKRSASP